MLLYYSKFNYINIFYHIFLYIYMNSWWRSTGFGEKLSFARDRLMENFFWTVGVGFEPELSYFRRMGVKINALTTSIDDVYDIYGTLDELELFTDTVER